MSHEFQWTSPRPLHKLMKLAFPSVEKGRKQERGWEELSLEIVLETCLRNGNILIYLTRVLWTGVQKTEKQGDVIAFSLLAMRCKQWMGSYSDSFLWAVFQVVGLSGTVILLLPYWQALNPPSKLEGHFFMPGHRSLVLSCVVQQRESGKGVLHQRFSLTCPGWSPVCVSKFSLLPHLSAPHCFSWGAFPMLAIPIQLSLPWINSEGKN